MEAEELSFEQAFEELEATIERLERGGLPLAEAIAEFERGMRLASLCSGILERAELRVTRLLADGQAEEVVVSDAEPGEAAF